MSHRFVSRRPGRRRPLDLLALSLLAVGLVAAGCAGGEEPAETPAEEEATPAEGAETATDASPASPYDDPGRPEADRAEDAGRRALEVYEFMEIEEGMTVADIYSSGGYNTHLLSLVVGDTGTVYSVLEFYSDPDLLEGRLYTRDALEERIEGADLANVIVAPTFEDVPDGSVDVAVAIRNYHDIGTFLEDESRAEHVAQLHRIVRPGGLVGIVEVSTTMEEGWDEARHTLAEQTVVDEFTAGGFELVEGSDLLRNPGDEVTENTFQAGRHTLDRYLLKFRKPEM